MIVRPCTSLEEGSLWSLPGFKKHSVYCLVEREKMDDILTELNLERLAAVFQQEIIVPSIVQSMSHEKIERLGVTVIGNNRNVGTCWLWSLTSFKLHPATSNKSQQQATTHNMVCKCSQHDCWAQQCYILFANNVVSVCTGLKWD